MEILPIKIEPQKVEHFTPSGLSVGYLNEYESLKYRGIIAKQKAPGYYIIYNGEKVLIQPSGKIDNWPTGLFDTMEILFAELFKNQTHAQNL